MECGGKRLRAKLTGLHIVMGRSYKAGEGSYIKTLDIYAYWDYKAGTEITVLSDEKERKKIKRRLSHLHKDTNA